MSECRILVSLLFLVASGCGSGSGARLAIVGGDDVSDEHARAPHLVALTHTNGKIHCSGVLAGDGIVLTAAHCIPSLRMIWRPTLSFSTVGEEWWMPELSAFNPKVRRIVRVVYHSGYDADAMDDVPTRPPHDIGLVFYEGGTPSGHSPASFLGLFAEGGSPKGSGDGHLRTSTHGAFGYGVTSTEGDDSGRLRSVAVTWNRRHEGTGVVQFGPAPGRGACFGDSGGPVFSDAGSVEALISYGPEEGADGPDCEQGRFYGVDLREYRAWIERNAGLDLRTGAFGSEDPIDARSFRL